jgi:hypothetical protein
MALSMFLPNVQAWHQSEHRCVTDARSEIRASFRMRRMEKANVVDMGVLRMGLLLRRGTR